MAIGRPAFYNLAQMSSSTRLRVAVVLFASALTTGAVPALAQAPLPKQAEPASATAVPATSPGSDRAGDRRASRTSVELKGLRSGNLTVGNSIKALGTLRPFAKGQKVTVLLNRGNQTVKRKTVKVHRKGKKGSVGKFKFSKRLVKPGRYSVEALHVKSPALGGSKDQSRRFHIRYPDLGPGASGDAVKTFNDLLADLGYVNEEGGSYDSATGRAVLAFHKVNGEARKESASSGMYKKLAKGKGGFNLQHPEAGKHVETDLSRQVMVLANGDQVDEIYHISSGAPATPTILGQFNFYRKDPGTNSLGMVHAAYFIRGYATHGYASVPDYPASHGCLRVPIPDSLHIYDWIDIGDPIYVYR